MKLKGFLYGHYDSRGGTAMIVAGSRLMADVWYKTDVCGYNADEDTTISSDDFMCEVTLHCPDDSGDLFNCDLEDQLEGRVIMRGTRTLEDWPAWSDDWMAGEDDMYPTLEGGSQDLEYVPQGQTPTVITEWAWPGWNDDAYGFWLVQAGNTESNGQNG